MITKLHIENYILIDFLDIDFQEGLNIITGETGAGKSILLGAIGLLLGNRADSSAAKSGSNCVIEAVFSLKGYDLQSLFDELELEYDDETIIRRVISSSGKSRAYINDLPVQLFPASNLTTGRQPFSNGSYRLCIRYRYFNGTIC